MNSSRRESVPLQAYGLRSLASGGCRSVIRDSGSEWTICHGALSIFAHASGPSWERMSGLPLRGHDRGGIPLRSQRRHSVKNTCSIPFHCSPSGVPGRRTWSGSVYAHQVLVTSSAMAVISVL